MQKKINLTTPINQLGYGIVGLNTTLALRELGCEVALWPFGEVVCPADKAKEIDEATLATGSYSKWAPSIRICQQACLAQHVGKGVHAAITYFERNRLYDFEINQLQNQDVVIASSAWMRDLLSQVIHGPKIAIARPGVDTAIFRPSHRAAVSAPAQSGSIWHDESMLGSARTVAAQAPTKFLVVGKWEVRKGHDLLASLFENAFAPTDNFQLILHCVNPFLNQEQHNAWARQFHRFGDKVKIHNERLRDQISLARVMAEADCGVFLSRAEGWNLDAAEMLAMGKNVIITNYSAHTEFVTNENSWLVEIDDLEAAKDGAWFDGFGEWARIGPAQLEQAVMHLRTLHQLKQSGRLGINQAGIDSMRPFSWRAFAQSVLSAIQD